MCSVFVETQGLARPTAGLPIVGNTIGAVQVGAIPAVVCP
jgi:hypothetical protein